MAQANSTHNLRRLTTLHLSARNITLRQWHRLTILQHRQNLHMWKNYTSTPLVILEGQLLTTTKLLLRQNTAFYQERLSLTDLSLKMISKILKMIRGVVMGFV
jgi:hypothetical protein